MAERDADTSRVTASSDLKPTLSELGAKVKELSETLERLLKESEVEAPTLAADSPVNISKFTPEIFTTKQALQDVMSDLSIISQGPSESVFNYAHNVCAVLYTLLGTVYEHEVMLIDSL